MVLRTVLIVCLLPCFNNYTLTQAFLIFDYVMQLSLNNILPQYLLDRVMPSSAVWGKVLSIHEGGKVFVQAPSGAGKTTLVHILYGLRNDYNGEVLWGDIQPNVADDIVLSRLRTYDLSIVFQDLRLFPQLTAWENIMVKAQLTNSTGEEQILQWMEQLGVLHKKSSLVGSMSYGEQQRIAILRALVQPFKWLLMDEPFSHLDKMNRDKAIALIEEVVNMRKAGIVYADLDSNNYFQYTQTLHL